MSSALDLKQIESKAFRFNYQDGLLDILLGTIIVGIGFYAYLPESGYSSANWVWFVLTFIVAQGIYWAGKKFITQPRMGQVRFGSIRQRKNKTLAIVMGIVILLQALIVGATTLGWFNPGIGQKLFRDIPVEHLAVAALSSIFVGPPLIFIAYMTDFLRGYYIALLFALAVFLMIYFNQPIYPFIIGGLVIVTGIVLFIRFLRIYPLPQGDESNG
ncbi:MAG TPA: hypothetical protein VLD65_06870 [Anaerolineales bacterium]|nr:hypothetical protein [Anaerolineales bacterium]